MKKKDIVKKREGFQGEGPPGHALPGSAWSGRCPEPLGSQPRPGVSGRPGASLGAPVYSVPWHPSVRLSTEGARADTPDARPRVPSHLAGELHLLLLGAHGEHDGAGLLHEHRAARRGVAWNEKRQGPRMKNIARQAGNQQEQQPSEDKGITGPKQRPCGTHSVSASDDMAPEDRRAWSVLEASRGCRRPRFPGRTRSWEQLPGTDAA